MSGTKTFEMFTGREQGLTSDWQRIGKLAARELQDTAMWAGSCGNQGELATIFDAGPEPIRGLLRGGGVMGAEGSFSVSVEGGEGFLPGASVDPDVSAYDVVRWSTQSLAWPVEANPDATNPKICLIVATPANVGADPQSRNILTDPTNRTVSPQIVNKTSNPVAALSVVVGLTGTSPAIPAVPAGAFPIWAVYVPPAVTESADFGFMRMTHRRLEFPGSSQHGILQGCVPRWALTNEATSNPPGLSGDDVHRVIIDGELLSFGGMAVSAEVDSANPPVAAGTHDAPYYLYLVGGRHAPQVNYISGVHCAPVRLVESLTPPNVWGMPGASLTVRGATIPVAACVYVGVGYIVAGGTRRKGCLIDGDWVYAMTRGGSLCPGGPCFNEPDVIVGSYKSNVSLATFHATATVVDFVLDALMGTSGGGVLYSASSLGIDEASRVAAMAESFDRGGGVYYTHMEGKGPIPPSGTYRFDCPAPSESNVVRVNLCARGYNMNLPRISR